MHESKHTISATNLRRKEATIVTPFQSYNSQTKQRNAQGTSYMTSSRKKTNQSLLEPLDRLNPASHMCLQHSLSVTAVCFSCNFALICHQCSKQLHNLPGEHDVRSLQKSSLFIKNTLIHSQIKLEAKCNILTNLNEQLKNHKIELFTDKNDYKQELEKNFDYIRQRLAAKHRQMIEEIEEIYKVHDKAIGQTISEIKTRQGYYDQCQQSISTVLEGNSQLGGDFAVCQFYSQKKDAIDQIVRENQLNDFKRQIYEVRYKIQNGQVNSILSALNDIQVGCDFKYTYFDQDFEEITESRQSSLKKAITKVKSQNQLKNKPSKKKIRKPIRYLDLEKTQKPNFPESRIDKQRQSHKINGTFCTSTPKQGVSHEKKFQFAKKSPQTTVFLLKKRKKSCAKMISMPASPAKQDKEQRMSPSSKTKDLIIDGMKKKTTIAKKKK